MLETHQHGVQVSPTKSKNLHKPYTASDLPAKDMIWLEVGL